jgi:hypothetical protein
MNNIELEDRLAKLERCCNENKSQFRELEERLRGMFERIDEQLRSVRPERAEIERGNPEFERDAEIELILGKFEKHFQLIEESKKEFYSEIANDEPNFTPKLVNLTTELFDLYKLSIHISRLYKLAGNIPLAGKYRQIAEKLYKDLQEIEDRMDVAWEKYRLYYTKKHPPNPYSSGFTTKTIFETLQFERYTDSSPSRVDLGGRKNKTRKNKVLHKR